MRSVPVETIVETRDLWKIFKMNGVSVEAVRGVDLTAQPGEFVAIVGPSGSGKSSLLHLLGAMDRPSKGEVLFQGQPLSSLSDGRRTDLRARKLGFVFQTFNLLPTLTAFDNVDVAMRLAGFARTERRARTTALLERVGLAERVRHRPHNLSGGERQRVAIARALANRPALLLADEPTGNLDTKTGATVLGLLRRVCDEDGQTVIMVTHDFRAASYADRVLLLRDGRVRGETRIEGGPETRQTLSQLLEAEL
jgi:putative ABC transport system ATP-binding protein